MIISGQPGLLLDEDYADLGAVDIPNAVQFVNPFGESAAVVAVNAEIDNNDSFLPLAELPSSNTSPGYGVVLAPGESVIIELNTRGVAQDNPGNLIVSVDGGSVYYNLIKV